MYNALIIFACLILIVWSFMLFYDNYHLVKVVNPSQQSMMKAIIVFVCLVLPSLSFNPACSMCHSIVTVFQHSAPKQPTEQILDFIGTTYCTQMHLQKHNVCRGAVREMIDSIVNSLWLHFTDPHAVCHKIRACKKEYFYRNTTAQINEILKGKPAKSWENPTNKKTLKVMHISDLHPDLFYTEGAPSDCSEPVCCRSNVTMKRNPWEILKQIDNKNAPFDSAPTSSPAGYWGSLNSCDLPMQTFNLFLEELKSINPDMIIWTGDNTPHDVWQQSQSYNLNFTVLLSQKLKRATNATVIAAMGNHQSFPVNVYDYEGDREKMLISGLAQAWKQWLDEKAYEMLRTKGYFSISLPKFNNLKIISVNTQAQNNQNWFLLRNPTDPGGMLKWIQAQLKQSQANNQFVYIIGHISPKSALNQWSLRFNALTDRYAYTIRGQFYGHSHNDQFGFFPSFANKSQISAYYLIAPSLQCGRHPGYRVMDIDYDTLQVTNYDQFMYVSSYIQIEYHQVHQKTDPARFEKLYIFKEAYGLKDMLVNSEMTDLLHKMKTDEATQIKYTHFRSSGVSKGTAGKDVVCDNTSSPQFEAECRGGQYKKSPFEKAAGRWKDLKHNE